MDILPTELHAYICQLACTDDGSSIRTLNVVSKYFQEVSRPYLYHNVSAFGMVQILCLLERLERTPPHMRHIHHLFLSDVPSDPSSSKSPFRLSDFENQALSRIITSSAPTLETLSLVANAPFSSTSLIARVFRTPFPLLHSLAISGFYPFPSSLGKFPSLKRLHLNGNRNPHGLLHMCSLEEACPSLTDLKITGLGAAGAFVMELEDALVEEQVQATLRI
ncbi:hypothetical protein BDZ97DRAFT_1907119 [Flammula alnicola]|nr:hypothetical protein BDZ97DRAFT_1907119 [Flammula alnicola]